MSRITQSIKKSNTNGKKAVIPYLPSGFPSKEHFESIVEKLVACDIAALEMGIPFSDPVADGPVVESASLQCLNNGVTLAWSLEEAQKLKKFNIPIIFMGYYNSFFKYGIERFSQDAAQAGLAGIIIPDLPLEESEEARIVLNSHGLDLIPLIGLNTSDERLERYAKVAQGFVYCVSVLGTTGVRSTFPPELKTRLKRIRQYFDIPLALGFGLKNRQSLEEFSDLIDLGIIGSSIIQDIESCDNLETLDFQHILG